jgi:hypothetical protein
MSVGSVNVPAEPPSASSAALAVLAAARDRIDGLAREQGVDPIELASAVNAALVPAVVAGSPAGIRGQAQAYGRVESQCAAVAADVSAVATASLPAAWQGQVAETAARSVQAVAGEIRAVQSVMAAVGAALESWALELEQAQQGDHAGVAQLESALRIVSGSGSGKPGYDMASSQPELKALPLAQAGVAARIAAAHSAQTAGTSVASLLNQYAERARARQVTATHLDALDAVVLATETNTGVYGPSANILSPTALALGSQRWDAMAAADRSAFEALLAQCKSPAEAAYVWKALAAGHSLDEVKSFAAQIQPHGADPLWLAEHLAVGFDDPKVGFGSDPAATGLSYRGQNWSAEDPTGYDLYDQGSVGDCVAASTVVAHAGLDPVVILGLTTGYEQSDGSAPALGDDSPTALQQRLQQLYLKEYAIGQNADGMMANAFGHASGVSTHGEDVLANQDLGSATGGAYAYRRLNTVADRQAVLPQIEAAVDAGKPVPFDVVGPAGGHQMLIVGREGSQFEVYNPWGFTEQVAESRFVDGQLGRLTSPRVGGSASGMPTADGIELPK